MKALISAVSITLLITATAFAQSAAQAPAQTEKTTPAMTAMVEGEVRKVDKEASKLTLRHGELNQLDMPAMTMVFRVKDPSMLDKVKAGDKVKFKAEGTRGALTITELETTK